MSGSNEEDPLNLIFLEEQKEDERISKAIVLATKFICFSIAVALIIILLSVWLS